MSGRDRWSSRLGFVLAASGSAIGLGNLWKFPFITWDNQGGAFVLVYLLCILGVGMPIMIAEIMIGKKTQKSAVGALMEAAGPAWRWVGGLGVATGFVILSYYIVIAGWTLRYFAACIRWSLGGFDSNFAAGEAFGALATNGGLQILLAGLFMVVTMVIVHRGIGGGIERVTRFLMPILFGILLLLLVSALAMKGSGEAVRFVFRPDFGRLEPRSALEALGHAFFTLSLGMGAMITYGSYLRREESVVRAATPVVILDTVIALIATVIMFSVIFSVSGMAETVSKSTAGMLFITLPPLFYTAVPLGGVLAPLFYLLVGFAALTSTIALLEVVVSYFIDRRGWGRGRATVSCGLVIFAISALCAMSLGDSALLSNFSYFYSGTAQAKTGLFAHLDHIASNWMLPVGGFFITLAAGWFITREASEAELVDENTPGWFRYGVWRFFIRWAAPLAVAAIIVAVIAGEDFS